MIEFIRIKSHQIVSSECDRDGEPVMVWANTRVHINPKHVVAASLRDEQAGQFPTLILETVDGSDHLFVGTEHNLRSFNELINQQ